MSADKEKREVTNKRPLFESRVKTRYVGWRCPERLWTELSRRAEKERRSVSNYIRNVLEDHVLSERSGKGRG